MLPLSLGEDRSSMALTKRRHNPEDHDLYVDDILNISAEMYARLSNSLFITIISDNMIPGRGNNSYDKRLPSEPTTLLHVPQILCIHAEVMQNVNFQVEAFNNPNTCALTAYHSV